jgi:hypothetical protein
MATTDFSEWLEGVDLSNYDDVDSLYRTVEELSDYGAFSIKEANGDNNGWIVYAIDSEDTLHIKTEKARDSFLALIEEEYCEGMSEHAWYTFHREMEKED